MTNETPAGWYTAPGEPGLERYWTGDAWGDDRRPAAPARPGSAPAPSTSPSGGEIAGFVLSIVALATSVVNGGVVFGLAALVTIAISERRQRRRPTRLGTAGNILAIIAIVITILVVVRSSTT